MMQQERMAVWNEEETRKRDELKHKESVIREQRE